MKRNKRSFLKRAGLGLGLLFNNSLVFSAVDYSVKKNPDQLKYSYGSDNPFSENKKPTIKNKENNLNKSNSGIDKDNAKAISPSNLGVDFWDKPRVIKIKRMQTGEKATIVYFENGRVNEKGYKLACYLLRDVKKNKVAAIDIRLLDLLAAIQAWLVYYGIDDYIVVTSGYRTKETNSALKKSAKNSQHLYGKAVDFFVFGLKPAQIAKIAKFFKAGGVGIYSNNNFIHIDTGRVRYWNG